MNPKLQHFFKAVGVGCVVTLSLAAATQALGKRKLTKEIMAVHAALGLLASVGTFVNLVEGQA